LVYNPHQYVAFNVFEDYRTYELATVDNVAEMLLWWWKNPPEYSYRTTLDWLRAVKDRCGQYLPLEEIAKLSEAVMKAAR